MTEIDITPAGEPPAEVPRKWTRGRVAGLLAIVLAIGVVAGVFGDRQFNRRPEEKSLPPGMAKYEPRNAAERELLKHLRAPTYSEAVAMGRATGEAKLGIAWYAYIAADDLVLPDQPLSQPITIGLPAGKKWKAGPLTNVRLVLADADVADLALGLRDGLAIYDRWCEPALSLKAMPDDCPHTPKPTTDADMYRNLRLLPKADYAKYEGLRFVPSTTPTDGNVYLATGDVTLHPYVGDMAKVPVIVLGEHTRIVGGEFGRIQVVGNGVGNDSRPDYEILDDPVYTATMPSDNPMSEAGERTTRVCGALSREVQQRFYPGACPQ